MVYRLKRISLMPLAVTLLILNTIFGFLMGIIVALGSMTGLEAQGIWSLGPWAIIILPIFNAVLGFITGIALSALYNTIVGVIGRGIEIELEEV